MKLFDFKRKTTKITNMKRRSERASTGYDMYGGGSNTLMEWYSPEYDRLDRPLLAEKWIPEDVKYLGRILMYMLQMKLFNFSIMKPSIRYLTDYFWNLFIEKCLL